MIELEEEIVICKGVTITADRLKKRLFYGWTLEEIVEFEKNQYELKLKQGELLNER